jgi:hypothetical protein
MKTGVNTPHRGAGSTSETDYFQPKHAFMKGARNVSNRQSKQGHTRKPRPDIRDDMDSRENKEIGYKGDKSKKGDRKKKK